MTSKNSAEFHNDIPEIQITSFQVEIYDRIRQNMITSVQIPRIQH